MPSQTVWRCNPSLSHMPMTTDLLCYSAGQSPIVAYTYKVSSSTVHLPAYRKLSNIYVHKLPTASDAIPHSVSSTAAKGPPKATSHAAHHNVAHTPSHVTDLLSSAYLVLLLSAGLLGGSSWWLTTCIPHTPSEMCRLVTGHGQSICISGNHV